MDSRKMPISTYIIFEIDLGDGAKETGQLASFQISIFSIKFNQVRYLKNGGWLFGAFDSQFDGSPSDKLRERLRISEMAISSFSWLEKNYDSTRLFRNNRFGETIVSLALHLIISFPAN